MSKEAVKTSEQHYKPYEKEYVANLLKMVGSDVQDNAPVGDEDYLKLALRACQEFNAELGDKSFDAKEGQDD